MKITGITWVGFRNENVSSTLDFYQEKLGLRLLAHDEDLDYAMFGITRGQILEVIGPKNRLYDYAGEPLMGFNVEHVPTAREELEKEGIKFVSETMESSGVYWAVFEGPGGVHQMLVSAAPRPENTD